MRSADGAGVMLSCIGVFEREVFLDMRIFDGLCCFFGESSCSAARSAFVNGFRFIGCGISSSELSSLSPMPMFCSCGAFDEKPCD